METLLTAEIGGGCLLLWIGLQLLRAGQAQGESPVPSAGKLRQSRAQPPAGT